MDSRIGVAQETPIFADDNVLISTTRLIVNRVTYPLSNVSSVRLLKRTPNYAGPIVLGLVGLFACLLQPLVGTGLIALGIIVAIVLRPQYIMLIGSAGGEKAALTSHNGPYVTHIVEQINNAIVARG
jgi:hypothetical protein